MLCFNNFGSLDICGVYPLTASSLFTLPKKDFLNHIRYLIFLFFCLINLRHHIFYCRCFLGSLINIHELLHECIHGSDLQDKYSCKEHRLYIM